MWWKSLVGESAMLCYWWKAVCCRLLKPTVLLLWWKMCLNLFVWNMQDTINESTMVYHLIESAITILHESNKKSLFGLNNESTIMNQSTIIVNWSTIIVNQSTIIVNRYLTLCQKNSLWQESTMNIERQKESSTVKSYLWWKDCYV